MTGRSSRIYFLQHLMRTLRRKRETVAFPQGEPQIAAHYQGHIALDMAQCRGCGLCVRICPAAAIEMTSSQSSEELVLVVYHDRCAVCGLCEVVCPTGAIRRAAIFSEGAATRELLREEWRREGGR